MPRGSSGNLYPQVLVSPPYHSSCGGALAPWMPCTAGLSSARAETVTFNFENVNVYSPLPVTLGPGSVSATM